MGGFRYALIGGHCHGATRDGLTRSQTSYVIRLAFSVWSCVGSGAKHKEVDSLISSDGSGLIVSEVAVWLPRLVVAKVMGQGSIAIYVLSICLLVCLSENRRGDKLTNILRAGKQKDSGN